MFRVAVLCSGNGSNLQALLERIASGHVHAAVTLVASDKPDAQALARARKARVPAVVALPKLDGETRSDHDARLLEILRAERPDIVVLAGYMRIIGPTIVAAFPDRIVNIHPSLLPAFQGLHAVRQAIAAGVDRAGCSTHIVTDDLDAGPVILQASVRVHAREAEADLQRRILHLEHLLLPRTVELFAQHRITVRAGKAQVAAGDSWLARQDLPLVSGAWYSDGF
ncbi:MAG: phosphoribosylglycinamide formyltransferase [bacterium]